MTTPSQLARQTTPGTDARQDAEWRVVRRRVLTKGGVMVAVPVTTAATSLVVAFRNMEPDSHFAALATPNWSTTVWVTSKSQTGCTIHFGTAAPSGAVVDLVIHRSE